MSYRWLKGLKASIASAHIVVIICLGVGVFMAATIFMAATTRARTISSEVTKY